MTFRDGIINIDKPEGWTSQDVCTKLRHRLHIKKTGHTGTLDPMATGVLPVCIGKATRIIEYYDLDMKSYHASMKLGIVTDTLDITGTILEQNDHSSVSEDAVIKAFNEYRGIIRQIPPKYSALKVEGRRAYDLAREGIDFELSGRQITITSNEISVMDLDEGIIEFDVVCSKGTYIRTICDDIGRELGCGAVMTSLRRTSSGYFNERSAVDIITLTEMSDDEINDLIIPMDETLEMTGKVSLNDNRVIAFVNGNTSNTGFHVTEASHFPADRSSSGLDPADISLIYRVYSKDRFLGIASLEKGALIPAKVIMTAAEILRNN